MRQQTVTIQEASVITGLSESHLKRMCKRGELGAKKEPHSRYGERWALSGSKVRQLATQRRFDPGSAFLSLRDSALLLQASKNAIRRRLARNPEIGVCHNRECFIKRSYIEQELSKKQIRGRSDSREEKLQEATYRSVVSLLGMIKAAEVLQEAHEEMTTCLGHREDRKTPDSEKILSKEKGALANLERSLNSYSEANKARRRLSSP